MLLFFYDGKIKENKNYGEKTDAQVTLHNMGQEALTCLLSLRDTAWQRHVLIIEPRARFLRCFSSDIYFKIQQEIPSFYFIYVLFILHRYLKKRYTGFLKILTKHGFRT